ncbi:tetratricopeptide repeat-containing sulfotransferase family protein [Kordiimonas marina]|uniref:tetratricopeptide repeat-containing sulfotransferase family protein n=1 Tax=Kordiimonas marina TaxID=2872312 RepID=UPI001FF108EB|nr:sulfotransferase [Kordiimonas marina]MCJ9427546.1 sulfotransferase [Kordiimonas marina]
MLTDFKECEAKLRSGDLPGAEAACARILGSQPDAPEGHLMMTRIKRSRGDFDGMLSHARKADALTPFRPDVTLAFIEALTFCGRTAEAIERLSALAGRAPDDAALLLRIAEGFIQLGLFEEAGSVYAKARAKAPADPDVLYNSATAAIALGDMDRAEGWLNAAIKARPGDYDAYYNRSTLKKQTPDHNHIGEMEGLLKAGIPDHKGAIQLFYALFKEYEDLGDWDAAFAHLQRGANLRAGMMRYRVDDDVAAMAEIEATFGAAFARGIPAASPEPGPIFIVGMPRTGTTLVDRILSSHNAVESLGEINDFALALTRHTGPVTSKSELIRATATLDFDALGASYLESTRGRGRDSVWLIDKTPANFLYLGLIARALPTARIIHLERGAMDSCFAIYKTLFRMGYPYSYRLEDLAAYYLAYRSLMAHWHGLMPGRILDVRYEQLVTEPETEVRRLLDHCGLDWQADCLNFHSNRTPSATASAAQIRQPLYTSSVGHWRHFEEQLTPLSDRLNEAGVSL